MRYKRMQEKISRRNFLKTTSTGIGLLSIVPSSVLCKDGNTAPNSKLNIAGVGVGGMGNSNVNAVSSQNIAALCDVDWGRADKVFRRRKSYPNAKRYKDYRVMLSEMGDKIDAVIIATPDHTHACIAMEAMRHGKHVYVQKPLAHSVHEARVMTEAARKYGVVTQMGNQENSSEETRKICEWIWDGAIGDVREVHAWTNRPIWPQAIARPGDTPPIPDELDWDLWLGPAPFRPYHPAYHPFKWRGWLDFGTGALGDIAAHCFDRIFWPLKLKYPTSVQASCAKVHRKKYPETFPLAATVHYEFPARQGMPPVKLHWYDGGLLPEWPKELELGRHLGKGGVIFIGDKGVLHATGPNLIPHTRMKAYKQPKPTIPRVKVRHEMAWVNAIKQGTQPTSNFNHSGPFTETALLGNIAMLFPGQKLLWDGANTKVTNIKEANKHVNPPYRQGWYLEKPGT